MQATQV